MLVGQMAGESDVMTALADPMPLVMLAEMLGMRPEEVAALRDPMRVMARGTDPDRFLSEHEIAARQQGEKHLEEVFTEQIERRRAHPGDDLLGMIAAVAGAKDRWIRSFRNWRWR